VYRVRYEPSSLYTYTIRPDSIGVGTYQILERCGGVAGDEGERVGCILTVEVLAPEIKRTEHEEDEDDDDTDDWADRLFHRSRRAAHGRADRDGGWRLIERRHVYIVSPAYVTHV
jgi:hypothetical protein